MIMNFTNLKIVVEPTVDSRWSTKDHLGALRVRCSIGRNNYRVEPGLYKIGTPDKGSDVFVSANYKLSFDILRKNMLGLNAWILVLDTKGVNVWCAAGKGTFGTQELIDKIESTDLKNKIDHKRIIVPQLGAPGVAAHKVKTATGFHVKFGPVRASDIKQYLQDKYKKSEEMQSVNFTFYDRLILSPVEIVNSLKYLVLILLVMLAISGFSNHGYSSQNIIHNGLISTLFILTSYISGAFLAPVLLPWLPFRSFGGKGLVIGILVFLLTFFLIHKPFSVLGFVSLLLMSMAISSFLAMNFTGASTYTSLSGVKKEMKFYVPFQITLASLGFIMLITSQFIA